ncbi:LapA family protein [Streptomyces pactum]|uniref:LapA family protein n=1 Tax=Streptomyces pactum TaxID=68249 RepID=A0ABS0NRN9_9ACTN|nr:LapA family protein [Streptomyces pactum]MBH5337727.1 LapA family protein [Streptomyces pactum]
MSRSRQRAGDGRHAPETARGFATPARIATLVIGVLALVFIFQNTRKVKIRLLVPEVTMPLWLALLGVWLIGILCGAFLFGRRHR